MEELKLVFTFNDFKNHYNVTEEDVQITYASPDKIQRITRRATFYLKEHSRDRLKFLMLCTETVYGKIQFRFAYWIPEELVNSENNIVDILEIFANKYGHSIKIAGKSGYFIHDAKKLSNKLIKDPREIVEVLDAASNKSKVHVFFDQYEEGNLYHVFCNFGFSINTFKYFIWLYNVPLATIKVEEEVYDYLRNTILLLDPIVRDSVKILKPRKTNKSDEVVYKKPAIDFGEKFIDLELPRIYLKPFEAVYKSLKDLKIGENLVVIKKNPDDKCVFCNASTLSAEHIFPKWFRDFFPEQLFESVQGEFYVGNEEIAFKNEIRLPRENSYGYTIQNVCIDCNTTWLSEIEEEVKEILAKDQTSLKTSVGELTLNAEKSYLLAKWIIIKSLLLSLKAHIPPIVATATFENLKNDIIPAGFVVEIADVPHHRLGYAIARGLNSIGTGLRLQNFDLEIAKEITKDFFLVSIQVGNFFFRISYWEGNQRLKRECILLPTTSLFPHGQTVFYRKISNEEETWNKGTDDNKIFLFNFALGLSDMQLT